VIKVCVRCGKKYTCAFGSMADKDRLCGICFRTTVSKPERTSVRSITQTPTNAFLDQSLPYYWDLLNKFDLSNCQTFEEIKRKFPTMSPAFLRKLIYLKGFKITQNGLIGLLEGGKKDIGLYKFTG